MYGDKITPKVTIQSYLGIFVMCKTNVYIEFVFSDIKHQQTFQRYKELHTVHWQFKKWHQNLQLM